MGLTSILHFWCVVHSSKLRSLHEDALHSTDSDLELQTSNTNLSQDQTVQNNSPTKIHSKNEEFGISPYSSPMARQKEVTKRE